MDNAVSLERLAAEVAGLREGQAGLRKGQALLRDGYASVRGALSELRETQAALCEVMVASGSLSMDKLLAQMHQRRFAAVRRTHPCRFDASIAEALGITGPAVTVARFAGPQAAGMLHGASKSMSSSMAEAKTGSFATNPGMLYICAGLVACVV